MWNTIRYLRPIQVYGRIWFHFLTPRVDLRAAPPMRRVNGAWVPGARRAPSLVGPTRFRLLNDTRDVAVHGWDDPALDTLWRYNLHYFDDLNATAAATRESWHRALLERWVTENPPGKGTGWEPYPTSLRIANWIKWAWGGNTLSQACLDSLAVQTRWLCGRLEMHLLGNHLFANAKALVFAGLFFTGPEAAAWLERGLGILTTQVPEQILADGGQFERSTMYQALALEDMLDLCNAFATHPTAIDQRWQDAITSWRTDVGSMRTWLAAMCHPDREIGFFNDAATEIAPSPTELERYAQQLGFPASDPRRIPVTHLRESGYVRLEQGLAVALLDVAPVGPDHLPAHAHADTLSFELSLFGRRILVNSGTSHYRVDAERLRQRGTAAHNTVVLDGADSSEVWSGFRVGRRARPLGLEILQGDALVVRCTHDGYERLGGGTRHTREWSLGVDRLRVRDVISGTPRHGEAWFHLHPSVAVVQVGSTKARLQVAESPPIDFSVEGGRLHQRAATWHPEFGTAVPTVSLVVELTSPELRTMLTWDPSA